MKQGRNDLCNCGSGLKAKNCCLIGPKEYRDVLKVMGKSQMLYHYTKKENLEAICREGIKPGMDGLVYMCTTVEEVQAFASVHLLTTPPGETIPIIQINPNKLDPNKLGLGTDHNPKFFGFDYTIVYQGKIPQSAFIFNELLELRRNAPDVEEEEGGVEDAETGSGVEV